jgi:hypothetical protein
VIIDPIVMAVAGDSHKNAETRRGLGPLVAFAERHNVVLLGITHFSKNTSGKSPVERVNGSLAFGALARVVLATGVSEDETKRVLVRAASNIGPSGDGFMYSLHQELLLDHDFTAQRAHWGSVLKGPAKELLAGLYGNRDDKELSKATNFLAAQLLDGPLTVAELKAAGEANGYAWRTIERAKGELAVVAFRNPGGRTEPWRWKLP